MPYNLTTLENGCRELGIELSQKQKNQFIQFYEFLVEKNKVMNLTGITEFEEVLTKHFLDSLACVKAIRYDKSKNNYGHRYRCRISRCAFENCFSTSGGMSAGFSEKEGKLP